MRETGERMGRSASGIDWAGGAAGAGEFQASDDGGGARAANGVWAGDCAERCSSCVRLRAMRAESSRPAITRRVPPQRRQVSMAMAKTRFRRCLQVIAVAGETAGPVAGSWSRASRPRPVGVTAARSVLWGANTP